MTGLWQSHRDPDADLAPCQRCGKAVKARGLCTAHYEAWRKSDEALGVKRTHKPFTDPENPPIAINERGCWTWEGTINHSGYGIVYVAGRRQMAHRWMYEREVGPIPQGLQIDHLCRNRACVNPDHLEPVTQRVNILRGQSPNVIAHHSGKCRRGHDMDEKNARIKPDGRADCRKCHALKERERKARLRGVAS